MSAVTYASTDGVKLLGDEVLATLADDTVETIGGPTTTGQWVIGASANDRNWNSVAYGDGALVAVSDTGTGDRAMYSVDNGITWTAGASAADSGWYAVAYGNGVFVAVSYSGTVMSSGDKGATWTTRTAAAANSWRGITYGEGLFVAVSISGVGNRVMTSPDGITWTIRTSAADNDWYEVAYGEGIFVAVANTGVGNRIMSSTDGITWTIRTSAADDNWQSVAYGSGNFVAVSLTGTVMSSVDGVTWVTRTAAAANNWNSVTYGNGLFVALAYSGTLNRVMTSPDGTTWTIKTTPVDNTWLDVTYGNGVFVAVGQSGTGNRVMTAPATDFNSDLSSNAIGMDTIGSLTKAVATLGGGMVAYSGFSPSKYLEQSYSSNLDFGTGDFSVALWFKTSVVGSDYLFIREPTAGGAVTFYGQINSSGNLQFNIFDGVSSTAAASLGTYHDNAWYFVVMQRSGTLQNIYVNTVLVASVTAPALTMSENDALFRFGVNQVTPPGNAFAGSIALGKVFGGLTVAEMQTIYDSEKNLVKRNEPYHLADESVSIDIPLTNGSSRSTEESKNVQETLNLTKETLFHEVKQVWANQTNNIPFTSESQTDFFDMKHFLNSVMRGQVFQFDDIGSVASPIELENVTLDSENHNASRNSSLIDYYTYSMRFKES